MKYKSWQDMFLIRGTAIMGIDLSLMIGTVSQIIQEEKQAGSYKAFRKGINKGFLAGVSLGIAFSLILDIIFKLIN